MVYAPGETVIENGVSADFVGRLVSGWLVRVRLLDDGPGQLTGLYLPGDYICLDSLFEPVNQDSIVAVSEASLVGRPTKEIIKIANSKADIFMDIGRYIVAEMDRMREVVGSLASRSAEDKLVGFMYRVHHRLLASSTIAPGSLSFDTPITQIGLANSIGVSKIHVNRIITDARKKKYFDIKKGTFTILNWEKFERAGKVALGDRT